MDNILTTQNLVLLVACFVNFLMSLLVIRRGIQNKNNLYFGLLAIFNALWAASLLIGRVVSLGMFWYYFGALLAYPIALCIAILLFYFCNHFPIKNNEIKPIKHILILIPALFLTIIIYINGAFILSYYKDIENTEYTLYVNKFIYILYSIYFIIVVSLALSELLRKIKILDSILRKQSIILFFSLLIGLIFGVYYDLFLCYFANYDYIWFGPIFTLFMNAIVFYFIVSPKEKINA